MMGRFKYGRMDKEVTYRDGKIISFSMVLWNKKD
jgi:hypothetical protein